MNKLKEFISQFSYTMFANFFKIITVGILTLVVPKLISQTDYGYWQLYVFYTSYVGFLHLGWCDGVYLNEGGTSFKDLNRRSYKSQFIYIFIMQLILSAILMTIVMFTENNSIKIIIFVFVCLNAITSTPCTFLSYLLQSTGEIKKFAVSNIVGRVIYFSCAMFFLLIGYTNYIIMLVADIIGLIITLLYLMYVCKDILKSRLNSFSLTIKEAYKNICVGSKLMIANIASSFIIGVTRLMMEDRWSIIEFGKISLSLNFCNLLLIFINAISIIIYPILRKCDPDNLKSIYKIMNNSLSFVLYIFLLLYFPIKLFILNWIPQYADSVKYMAILFPICIFEARVSLIINTYLKVIRKEKLMMLINLGTLGISVVFSYISVYLLNNMEAAIFSIVVVLGIKCVFAECILAKLFNSTDKTAIIYEIIISVSFVVCNWLFGGLLGILIYSLTIIIYIYLNKRNLYDLFKTLKCMII